MYLKKLVGGIVFVNRSFASPNVEKKNPDGNREKL
jgi:hypothetical protein